MEKQWKKQVIFFIIFLMSSCGENASLESVLKRDSLSEGASFQSKRITKTSAAKIKIEGLKKAVGTAFSTVSLKIEGEDVLSRVNGTHNLKKASNDFEVISSEGHDCGVFETETLDGVPAVRVQCVAQKYPVNVRVFSDSMNAAEDIQIRNIVTGAVHSFSFVEGQYQINDDSVVEFLDSYKYEISKNSTSTICRMSFHSHETILTSPGELAVNCQNDLMVSGQVTGLRRGENITVSLLGDSSNSVTATSNYYLPKLLPRNSSHELTISNVPPGVSCEYEKSIILTDQDYFIGHIKCEREVYKFGISLMGEELRDDDTIEYSLFGESFRLKKGMNYLGTYSKKRAFLGGVTNSEGFSCSSGLSDLFVLDHDYRLELICEKVQPNERKLKIDILGVVDGDVLNRVRIGGTSYYQLNKHGLDLSFDVGSSVTIELFDTDGYSCIPSTTDPILMNDDQSVQLTCTPEAKSFGNLLVSAWGYIGEGIRRSCFSLSGLRTGFGQLSSSEKAVSSFRAYRIGEEVTLVIENPESTSCQINDPDQKLCALEDGESIFTTVEQESKRISCISVL